MASATNRRAGVHRVRVAGGAVGEEDEGDLAEDRARDAHVVRFRMGLLDQRGVSDVLLRPLGLDGRAFLQGLAFDVAPLFLDRLLE